MSDIKVGNIVTMRSDSFWWKKGDKAKIVKLRGCGFEGDFSINKEFQTWGEGQATWNFDRGECKKEKTERGIRIKAEKYENYGRRFIRILEIDALEKKDLPEEYVSGEDCFWLEGNMFCNALETILEVGRKYEVFEFTASMQFIKQCGIRLEEINKKKKKEKPAPPEPKKREWSGIKEYII